VAIQAATFSDLTLDWEGSLASDHAMLHVTGHTAKKSENQNMEMDLGFLIDPEKSKEWIHTFKGKSSLHLFQPNPIAEKVDDVAEALMADIQQTNEVIFRQCRP